MGMFDSIMVPCPKCGRRREFQSKSGGCYLETYELDRAPLDVLLDVNRHAPYSCEQCGTLFAVHVQAIGTPIVVGADFRPGERY